MTTSSTPSGSSSWTSGNRTIQPPGTPSRCGPRRIHSATGGASLGCSSTSSPVVTGAYRVPSGVRSQRRQRRRLRPRRSALTTPCNASPDARPACSTDATSAMTRIPGCSVSREGTTIGAKLGTPLPPRQRHVEADAQERPDEGGGAEKCRGTEHEPEIADAQAHEGGDPSPRRPDPERRVRADVARGLDREVEPHVARRRVRPELADGERAGPRGERGAEDEPLRAADDRPLIDEFTEAGGERHRRERSGAQRASVADIEALDLPSAADRVGETDRQEPAARPLRGERRGQTRQAYQ